MLRRAGKSAWAQMMDFDRDVAKAAAEKGAEVNELKNMNDLLQDRLIQTLEEVDHLRKENARLRLFIKDNEGNNPE